MAHLTVSLYLRSSGSNAQGESRALEGHVSAQKALQGSETETRDLLGGREEKSISPDDKGPPGKSMIFHKKELVARPIKVAVARLHPGHLVAGVVSF